MSTLPDLIVIGAMKAGTTFLYNCLVQHPLVAKARRKEPHFFDWRWPSELDARSVEEQRAAYMEYFEHELLQHHTSIVTGEATPSYLLYGVLLRVVAPASVFSRSFADCAFSHLQVRGRGAAAVPRGGAVVRAAAGHASRPRAACLVAIPDGGGYARHGDTAAEPWT